jgi:hypothetical protein
LFVRPVNKLTKDNTNSQTCTLTHTHIYTHTNKTHIHTHTPTFTQYIHTLHTMTHIHTNTHSHTYTHTHTFTHITTHTHSHTLTYSHTNIHTPKVRYCIIHTHQHLTFMAHHCEHTVGDFKKDMSHINGLILIAFCIDQLACLYRDTQMLGPMNRDLQTNIIAGMWNRGVHSIVDLEWQHLQEQCTNSGE